MAERVVIEGKSLEELEREITCGICQEHYTEPKILPCLHYYCKQCVLRLSYRTASDQPFCCPECRHEATLPEGGVDELKTAFFINRLKTTVTTMKQANSQIEVMCELCSDLEGKAKAFCRQCAMFICKDCIQQHKRLKILLNHDLALLEDLKQGKAPPIIMKQDQTSQKCSEHYEPVIIYCFDCKVLICRDCTIKDHHGHNFEFCRKVVANIKEKLLNSLKPLKLQSCNLLQARNEVKSTKSELETQKKSIAHSIKTSFNELRSIIDKREQELLQETSETMQNKINRLSLQEKQFSLAIAEIQSVVDYTEQCTKHGSEEEIMSVHAEITRRIYEGIGSHLKNKKLEPVEEVDIGVSVNCTKALQQLCQMQAKMLKFVFDPMKTKVSIHDANCFIDKEYKILISTRLSNNEASRTHHDVSCFFRSLLNNTITHCVADRIRAGHYSVQYTSMMRGSQELTVSVDGNQVAGTPIPVFFSVHPSQLGRPVKICNNLSAPSGIAVNSIGEVLVSEAGGMIVKCFADGSKVPVLNQKIIKYFRKLAVDDEDNIYGIDGKSNRILKCNKFGENIQVQQSETKNNTFRGLAVVGEEVLVCELNNMGTIVAYDKELRYKRCIESKDKGQFVAIAADCHKNLYCADLTNSCIQVFSNDGTFLHSFGTDENEEKKVKNPWGLCVSGDYVYVCNDGFCNVSVFTTDGVYVTSFGQCGSNEGDFNYPHSICVDKNGFVYVTDCNNCRVQCF